LALFKVTKVAPLTSVPFVTSEGTNCLLRLVQNKVPFVMQMGANLFISLKVKLGTF